ncbi:MAG: hypothetical protein FH748_08750 [Balneolaceae bacterium]|nr:hypothetical protein [Balneolaceae bacterium]
MNRLDVKISSFPSVRKPDAPTSVNLLDWLRNDNSDVIQQLRCLSGEAYQVKKRSLSGITPSGTFSNRGESGMIEHSGLIQFDIDSKDNAVNMDDLKFKIQHIPYVAYLSYSTSGNGLWGLIPIKHKDQHKAHFRAIQKAFSNTGITIDPAPSNVASFRFISYDPDPYFNVDAEVFTYTIDNTSTRPTGRNNREKVEELVDKISMTHTDITDSYDNWLKVGFALSEEFGESGRSLFHRVSQWHPDYNSRECDVQYNKCLKSNRNGITIASFFHLCKVHGIELTKSDPIHYSQKDRALQGKYEAQENAPYGYNPYTGEIFDERGYPSEWDFHLN